MGKLKQYIQHRLENDRMFYERYWETIDQLHHEPDFNDESTFKNADSINETHLMKKSPF